MMIWHFASILAAGLSSWFIRDRHVHNMPTIGNHRSREFEFGMKKKDVTIFRVFSFHPWGAGPRIVPAIGVR